MCYYYFLIAMYFVGLRNDKIIRMGESKNNAKLLQIWILK